MKLPRLHLFELNDSAWVPKALREQIIETLGRALDWGHMLEPLVGPFRQFLLEANATTVIDLAAGAGGPARVLLRELTAAGASLPKRFVLTNLQPAVEAWAKLRAEFPGVVEFVEAPVDVTALPPELDGARLIINALHHFPPALAQKAMLGMCAGAPGVFVAEGLVRNPMSFIGGMAPMGLKALLADPVLATSNRVQRALTAWVTPVAALASLWDGTVSSFRCYSEEELRAMVEPLGASWRWTYGTYAFNAFGRGTYFYGVPTAS